MASNGRRRAALLVDTENLLYILPDFDWSKLRELALETSQLMFAEAYINFMDALRNNMEGTLNGAGLHLVHCTKRGDKDSVDFVMSTRMIAFANCGIEEIILVTADNDFHPAVMTAQNLGVRIHLMLPATRAHIALVKHADQVTLLEANGRAEQHYSRPEVSKVSPVPTPAPTSASDIPDGQHELYRLAVERLYQISWENMLGRTIDDISKLITLRLPIPAKRVHGIMGMLVSEGDLVQTGSVPRRTYGGTSKQTKLFRPKIRTESDSHVPQEQPTVGDTETDQLRHLITLLLPIGLNDHCIGRKMLLQQVTFDNRCQLNDSTIERLISRLLDMKVLVREKVRVGDWFTDLFPGTSPDSELTRYCLDMNHQLVREIGE